MDKLKIFGIITTIIGAIVGLISSFIDDKKMERRIDDAVAKRFE